jgi:hypothetical protein
MILCCKYQIELALQKMLLFDLSYALASSQPVASLHWCFAEKHWLDPYITTPIHASKMFRLHSQLETARRCFVVSIHSFDSTSGPTEYRSNTNSSTRSKELVTHYSLDLFPIHSREGATLPLFICSPPGLDLTHHPSRGPQMNLAFEEFHSIFAIRCYPTWSNPVPTRTYQRPKVECE